MPYQYNFNPFQQQTTYTPAYQPQMPQQTYSTGILWGSYEEACAYPLAPNAAVTIWDRNQKTIYWKQSDASGRQSLQIIDYTYRNENQDPTKAESEPATKEDFEKVFAAIGEIQALLKGGAENA
jgi:hypothetical protein